MFEKSTEKITLRIKRLDKSIPLPGYAHPGDAGLDLYSAEDVVLLPLQRKLVSTGIKIEIPYGYAGFVQPKSGRAVKEGLSIVNTPGLIDAGYRGEVKVILINLDSEKEIRIRKGEKIAQLVIQRVEHAEVIEVDELTETSRGEGGFGSTGI
ncbi:MAG: dUTP diphosphatase [Actinobacteria bacterium]|nr:dUTP diphosphatase [Actinomycetota bacterium]